MKKYSGKKNKVVKGMPSAVLLSILIHAALFLLAGMLVVFTVVKKEEKKFVPPKAVERPKMKLKKPKVKIKKTSKPRPTTRIVTKVNRASMPDIQLPEMSGMGGEGLGGGLGGFDMMPDLEDVSIFGGSQTIGNDFEGQLYSFNYDRSHRKIPMGPEMFLEKVRGFVLSGWNTSKLARYYRSPRKLYTTHFMIPPHTSTMAPEKFGEPGLEGFNFMVHYKGDLVCPASYTNGITFRFRGSGDDFLFIRVGGENVFLARWNYISGYFDWWRSSSADNRKYYMASQWSTVGDWITLEPGKPLAMELLIGDGPGGAMGCLLAVEVEGEEYKETGWMGSNPLFPAFKTAEFSRDMIDEIQFYLPEGEASLAKGPVFRDYDFSEEVATDDGDADGQESRMEEKIPLREENKKRTWAMVDGRTFEAEFVARIGTKAVFKNAKGKTSKIPLEQVSEEGREFIELEKPPALKISFSKQSRKKDWPSAVNGKYDFTYVLPVSSYYTFSAEIEQTSPEDYGHELRGELFSIGADIGDSTRYVFLDREAGSFTLAKENQRSFRLKGRKEVELFKFSQGSGEAGRHSRGWKYASYLVVVTDARGKIIAYETPKKWLFENLERLRELSVGNYFDNTCTRIGPSRPAPNYNSTQ